MSDHTPTPWHTDPGIGDGCVWAKEKTGQHTARLKTICRTSIDDAAFIVRAVNSHDELVAVLKGIVSSGESAARNADKWDDIPVARAAYDDARAAIAKAEAV